MRRLKKISLIVLALLIAIFLFRKPIFQTFFSYQKLEVRPLVELTNASLLLHWDEYSRINSIKEIVKTSCQLTCQQLRFTFEETSGDPNVVYRSQQANCVGYAALFASTATVLLEKNNVKDYKVNHVVGEIFIGDTNLHDFFDSPFFRNHDYVEIVNLKTGKISLIDPSVCDYLWISEVSERTN